MTVVDIHPQAAADLLAQTEFLSGFSLPSARKLIEAFEAVLVQLRQFPESGVRSPGDPRVRIIRRAGYQFLYTYASGDGAILMEIRSARMGNAES